MPALAPTLAHVTPEYGHYAKRADPRETLALRAAELKFYHVEKPGEPVPAALEADARDFLEAELWEGALGRDGGDYGFVILHRCGADFYFLLLSVWRGANELWEAVYYRDGAMDRFAPFDPAYPPSRTRVRPTFCVWELGVVAQEARAWSRFLASPRSDADLDRWRGDRFSGEV